MENNGIVRRIDDLGRIVIPREYRKLHGIDLGDPVEISAMQNGEIIIKKVDVKSELIKNAKKIISPAEREIDGTLLVSDGEKWIWGRGDRKGEFVDMEVSKWVKNMIAHREVFVGVDGEENAGFGDGVNVIFYPAVSNGDCYGALCVISDLPFSPNTGTLVGILAKILGEYMNKY